MSCSDGPADRAPQLLAIIGGTGFGEYAGLTNITPAIVDTPYGTAYLERGLLHQVPLVFLPRHGQPASFPPHRVNYRANIAALTQLGISQILAITAVGSVDTQLPAGAIVMPDQVIDYTHGRAQTFYDDEIHHIDFTYPYTPALRTELAAAVVTLCERDPSMVFRPRGVYGCTQGPRLETAAEISRMARDGCTIVGMTAMPEATLAREKGVEYAGLSVVVNAGAGINDQAVDLDGITAVMVEGMGRVRQALSIFVERRYQVGGPV
jgi:5'-methylthioinosine phosphorylase